MKLKQGEIPLILVTNDDGIHAKGLEALVEVVKPFGDVVVVAPDKGNSAKSHAVTLDQPLFYKKRKEVDNVKYYACSGTPVDCVKMGINTVLPRHPDFVVSGINHGSNASINVIYSGTMAGAIEGCINGIPSIGFSVTDHAEDLDFTAAKKFAKIVFDKVFNYSLTRYTCLNVNIPYIHMSEIKGIKVCKQARGKWDEEFDRRSHPHGRIYYWLTGRYINLEPENENTDSWGLDHNYVTIVPIKTDMTDYEELKRIRNWNLY